jgi:hypothetical protein
MEWKIDYLEKDGIVSAKVTGLMDWDQHKKFAEDLFPFARKHNAHKILVDFLEMTPRFTILQVDDLPGLLKELGVGPEDRIAALHNPSAPHHSENVFFKDAATIKSITVRYFTSKDDAITWLKSYQPFSEQQTPQPSIREGKPKAKKSSYGRKN